MDVLVGTSVLAHGIHYAVLAVGLVGLAVLLGPQLLGIHRERTVHDEHDRKVLALADQIAAGTLGSAIPASTRTVSPAPPLLPSAAPDARASLLLPIAVVSSTAAAVVHAAVCPEHFAEKLIFGLFFAGSAIAQIIWSVVMVMRPRRPMLLEAAYGNAAVVALWAVTRTVGLPFGLLPKPEEVGPWDVCCGIWELIAVGACIALLRRDGALPRLAAWAGWRRSAQLFTLGSVAVIAGLYLSGAGA
ncbi:MAG TPA: hypothetical protein VHZ06_01345 [Marmoricola sp.]|jgi:hypothetical protein|nr:hypothetical protein [Marmoricola sp.]